MRSHSLLRRTLRGMAVALALYPRGAPALDPPMREAEFAAVRLHTRKADVLLQRYAASTLRDREVRRELDQLSKRLDRARADSPPPPIEGLSEEAYVSPIDGSAQPFFRYLPSAWHDAADGNRPSMPLLVYLHGYAPNLDLINWAVFPEALTDLAEQKGVALAIPFGRSNTDFQGIGEQDVLTVIDLMQVRYQTDPQRVVLLGYSMGGMGAWTIGARFAERFNGLLMVCGRADYDVWHRLEPHSLPAWEREFVDAHFLPAQAERLACMPILAYHGALDPLVRRSEAEAAFRHIRAFNDQARLVVIPGADHWVIDRVLDREDCREWLRTHLHTARDPRPDPQGLRPGEVPSGMQNAFLDPFLFVHADLDPDPASRERFEQRCREWLHFAKAMPRHQAEAAVSPADLERYHLFLFGEPESSPLIRRVLASMDVAFDAESLDFQGRRFARAEHGFWIAVPSPFAGNRTVVLQLGIPWGEHLPPNHRYDMVPDLLVYTAEAGRIGINRPVAAARVTDDRQIRWYPDAPHHAPIHQQF